MTTDELRTNLKFLIDRYVTDQAVKVRLHALLARPQVPTKGILVDLGPFFPGTITEPDSQLVKEIAYYFC